MYLLSLKEKTSEKACFVTTKKKFMIFINAKSKQCYQNYNNKKKEIYHSKRNHQKMSNRGKVFAQEARAALDAFKQSLPHTINFYRQQELPFGVFSNFFPAPLIINKIDWLTSEHYFQAMKFEPTCRESFQMVALATTPGDAAGVGRDRSRPLRPDWETAKDLIMFDVLTAKFLQYEDLLHILMSTKGSKLVEHTRNDKYWGDGGDGSGKNMLGRLLMLLRDVLGSIDNLKSEKTKINEVMRETGVNPLRAMISPVPGSSGDYFVVSASASASASSTANANDDDQQEQQTSSTAASSSQPSSKAHQRQTVQKKNRLQ